MCKCLLPGSPLPQASSPVFPGNGEVFQDNNTENPAGSRSSECGFSDFVQYRAGGSDEADPQHPSQRPGRGHSGPSGPSQARPQERPVMQRCLEHFQRFLSHLITLYIVPQRAGHDRRVESGELEPAVAGPQGACVRPRGRTEAGVAPGGPGTRQTEYVRAFAAGCQLFLECSSFPVYIAEGNLQSSPSQEEQRGETGSLHVIVTTYSLYRGGGD